MLQQEKLFLEARADLLKYLIKTASSTQGAGVWQQLFTEMKCDLDNRLQAYKEIPSIICEVRRRAVGEIVGGIGTISVTRKEPYNWNESVVIYKDAIDKVSSRENSGGIS